MTAILALFLSGTCGYCEELQFSQICTANLTEKVSVAAVDSDGDLRLQDGRILRLEGIDWPAADQVDQRAILRQSLLAQVSAPQVLAEVAAQKDRWGRQAAQLFVGGASGALVWVQGQLLEAGLLAAWPEPARPRCWSAAMASEARARKTLAGIWSAFTPQEGTAILRAQGDSPMSQRVVFESDVTSVRPGRRVTFVNFAGPRDRTPYLMMSARQIADFRKAGRDPATFVGKRLRLRADMDHSVRPRLSVSGLQAIDVLE